VVTRQQQQLGRCVVARPPAAEFGRRRKKITAAENPRKSMRPAAEIKSRNPETSCQTRGVGNKLCYQIISEHFLVKSV